MHREQRISQILMGGQIGEISRAVRLLIPLRINKCSLPAGQNTFFCSGSITTLTIVTTTQLPLRFIFLLDFLMSTNAKLLFFFLRNHLGSCLLLCLGTTKPIEAAGIKVMIVPVATAMARTFNLSKVEKLFFFFFVLFWLICGQSCSNTFFLLDHYLFWLL